jgi:hypothetical protein
MELVPTRARSRTGIIAVRDLQTGQPAADFEGKSGRIVVRLQALPFI